MNNKAFVIVDVIIIFFIGRAASDVSGIRRIETTEQIPVKMYAICGKTFSSKVIMLNHKKTGEITFLLYCDM